MLSRLRLACGKLAAIEVWSAFVATFHCNGFKDATAPADIVGLSARQQEGSKKLGITLRRKTNEYEVSCFYA